MKNLGLLWLLCVSMIMMAIALGIIERRNDQINKLEKQRAELLDRTTGLNLPPGETIGVECKANGEIRVYMQKAK